MEQSKKADLNRIDFHSLLDILSYRAKNTPQKIVYTFLLDGENKEISYTYSELDQKARDIASILQNEEIMKGDRALLLYQPGLDFIAGFFGCLYASVIAVPAYPPEMDRINKTLPRLLTIINDCQPSIILTSSDIFSMAKSMASVFPETSKIKWLSTDNIENSVFDYFKNFEINKNDIAFLQYTSGSTSAPKGVMISHENIMHNEEIIRIGMDHDSESGFVSWLPQYHDMGLIVSFR